jgi:hypothetical protein
MKTKAIIFSAVVLLCMTGIMGCSDEGCTSINACNYDDEAKIDDGSCINKGAVTFWQDSLASGYDVIVTINATEATISSRLGGVPACHASGCASFSLCPGSHHYTAREVFPGLNTWSGDATATEEGCLVIKLQ